MLNTDLHNELIKNKMTLAQFISNNRGINNGGNIPPLLLKTLYYSIKYNEIKMSGVGINGDVSDALWSDLMTQSGKLWTTTTARGRGRAASEAEEGSAAFSLARRYVRLDSLHDEACDGDHDLGSCGGDAPAAGAETVAERDSLEALLALVHTPSPIVPAALTAQAVPVPLPAPGPTLGTGSRISRLRLLLSLLSLRRSPRRRRRSPSPHSRACTATTASSPRWARRSSRRSRWCSSCA